MVITGDLVLSTQIDSTAASALYANSSGSLTVLSDAMFVPDVSAATAAGLVTNATYSYVDVWA